MAGDGRRGRLRAAGRRAATGGGTTASTASSTTSTRSRVTTTSPGSRARMHGMLDECGVPRGDAGRAHRTACVRSAAHRRIAAYDEAPAVLRRAPCPRASCSRSAPTGTGTSRRRSTAPGSPARSTSSVSSAWVGARKPHRRMYDARARPDRRRTRGRVVRRRHVDLRRRRPAGRGARAALPAPAALRRRHDRARRPPRRKTCTAPTTSPPSSTLTRVACRRLS